jgi:hypothetical protein
MKKDEMLNEIYTNEFDLENGLLDEEGEEERLFNFVDRWLSELEEPHYWSDIVEAEEAYHKALEEATS